jgi:hypothetical protein
LYNGVDSLLCRTKKHSKNCRCDKLRLHFGSRPFKCSFIGCTLGRHGFEERNLRKAHEDRHKILKCDIPGCPYAKIRFPSKKFRDEHLRHGHRGDSWTSCAAGSKLDKHESEALLFDLVKKNNVEAVARLLPTIQEGILTSILKEGHVVELAAASASAQMMEVFASRGTEAFPRRAVQTQGFTWIKRLFESACQAHNVETLHWLLLSLSRHCEADDIPKDALQTIIERGSTELFALYEQYFVLDTLEQRKGISHLFDSDCIRATQNLPAREEFLLSLWSKLKQHGRLDVKMLDRGLWSVTRTTCSVELAERLVGYGADVNAPWGNLSMLEETADHRDLEAAELLRFLLYHGAEPSQGERTLGTRKGAKNIARWLGKSWDQLVRQVQEDQRVGKHWPGRSGLAYCAILPDNLQ